MKRERSFWSYFLKKDLELKRILLWVIFFIGQFLSISLVHAEWTVVNPPNVSSNWELLDVRFFWAVGRDSENKRGVLLRFSNGSWTSVSLPDVSQDWGLSAIDFGSSYEGWAVGQDFANQRGALLRYSNGAWASMEPLNVSSDWGLSAIAFISSDEGWAVGRDSENKRGVLLHFSNVPVTPPALSTTAVSGITTTTASSGGTIFSDGGTPVTARGVCWSASPNPAVGGSCTSDGTGTGTFTSSITGLTPSATYHVRAYATNSAGTGYGNDVTFSTLPASSLPTLSTMAVSGITTTTASSGGTIFSDGGTPVTARGVCWSTSPNPAVGGSCTIDGTGTGTFTSSITGLTPSATYHVRAYATNSAGTGYGNDLTFATLFTLTPFLPTLAATTISRTDTTDIETRTLWTSVNLPFVSSDWELSDVCFVWAVGQDNENKRGILLHFSNGSWTSVSPPDVSQDWGLSAIDFISSDEGWAVGRDSENKRGVLLRFSNGSWTSVSPPDVSQDWGLSAIDFISSDEGWAVGWDSENKRGVLLRFSNGSWTSVSPPDVSQDWGLSAIDFIFSDEGWAVGQASDGQNVKGVLLRYAVPQISVSPASIDYQDIEIGASLDQKVGVRNNGNGNLIIGPITLPSSPFSINADSCSGQTLAPLRSCEVIYRFLPNSEGIFSDSSNIPSNDPHVNPVTVTLIGTGVAGTSNSIHLLSPLNGQMFTACSDSDPPLFQWDHSGIFTSIEIQFSLTNDFSKVSFKVRGSPDVNQLIINSYTWERVFLLPGTNGGKIYWMVVGKKRDRTEVRSNVFSFEVETPKPVANPEMSHTSKSTLPPPTLSWANNCNTKFKVWFGNDPDFQKGGMRKIAISYDIKDPNENQGMFTRELTSRQWSSIRNLGANVTGAILYWYVESSDIFGRQKETDVMTFVLAD